MLHSQTSHLVQLPIPTRRNYCPHLRNCQTVVISHLCGGQLCSLDPMPSRLVSEFDCLLPVISTIINKSLQNGGFLECLKEALILPLLKKRQLAICRLFLTLVPRPNVFLSRRSVFYRAKAPPAKKNVGLWGRECLFLS